MSNYDHSRDEEFEILTVRSLEDGFNHAWFMICDLERDETHVFATGVDADGKEYRRWNTYHDNLSRAKDVYPMLEAENP